jgi:hypothetical protein
MSMFYQPSSKPQFYLFVFTLFLSFTMSFVQGSIFMMFLFIVFRKVNLI